MSIKDWAEEGAEVGLDGIDLSILFLKSKDPSYLDAVRREIEDAHIRVAMVTTYPDFTHPDPNERMRELSKLQENIVAASRLGADLVRRNGGPSPPNCQAKRWHRMGCPRIKKSRGIYEKPLSATGIRKPCQTRSMEIH